MEQCPCLPCCSVTTLLPILGQFTGAPVVQFRGCEIQCVEQCSIRPLVVLDIHRFHFHLDHLLCDFVLAFHHQSCHIQQVRLHIRCYVGLFHGCMNKSAHLVTVLLPQHNVAMHTFDQLSFNKCMKQFPRSIRGHFFVALAVAHFEIVF